MRRRVARRGRNAGGEFWGCSRYPSCRGTRDLDDVGPSTSGATAAPAVVETMPPEHEPPPRTPRKVAWHDATVRRPGWHARYTTAGATLRSVTIQEDLLAAASTCWIAREDVPSYRPVDDDTRRVIGMVRKLLQRGLHPPLHPDSERQLLVDLGYEKEIVPSGLPGDVAPALTTPPRLGLDPASVVPTPENVVLDPGIELDSLAESAFLSWATACNPAAARWIVPQAPFDLLLEAAGLEGGGERRVDFLVSPPGRSAFIVEIDGQHHTASRLTDGDRDRLLADAGYEVIRVPAAEARAGDGPALSRVAAGLPGHDTTSGVEPLLWVPAQVHRLMLALLDAVQSGLLAGDQWSVEVVDPIGGAGRLVGPYLDLLAAVDELWGGRALTPELVVLKGEVETTAYRRSTDGTYDRADAPATSTDLIIHLEAQRTPMELLPVTDGTIPRMVVRSSNLPVRVRDIATEGSQRTTVRVHGEAARRALTTVLRAVFAKAGFRQGQYEALTEVLEGRDCAVLLPTGAGKSLIYQLAGLCLPGRTLVVDPIVALIEDQAEGLATHGIDRVAAIHSDSVIAGQADLLLDEVASADALFILVAPERLQQQRFRNAITELAAATPINLAVVDEAHCVSEWGHQFRTSYLTLGRTLRAVCADPTGAAPPLLALTGTASRAVLRDVMFQLDLAERSENTIVRPPSFDRPELRYRVLVTDPARSSATLSGALRALPGEFGEPAASFFQPNGRRTYAGLAFCAVVNGPRGIIETAHTVRAVVGARPGIFSGRAPREVDAKSWPKLKRAHARRFKDNDVSVLVATNAFGMGIDKPNIRWVVHFGLPSSIEAYYQEVGRAGRDGQPAECILVLTEFDRDRSLGLLDESLSLEEARFRHQMAEGSVASRDDITTGVYFHVGSFPGVDEELGDVLDMARGLEPGEQPRAVSVPFVRREEQERALHRLVMLGVVGDYLVEWGSQAFEVRVNGVRPDDVVAHLLSFVERSQPGRLATVAAAVERRYPKLMDAIEACGRTLIEFVYETIERSRRRSLREMYLVASTAVSDGEIRQRVLDYLSEGDIAPVLERLAETARFSFAEWQAELAKITSTPDAREWRGTTARLLGSYPDHPGLLAGRALAEGFDPAGDIRELEAQLWAAITAARQRYGVPDADTASFLAWVAGRFRLRRPAVVTAAVGIAQQAGLETGALDQHLARALTDPIDPGLAVLRLTTELAEARALADQLL